MRVERLVLRNWCRFKHIDVTFGQMTAIRGPNGIGKTSLVRAIPYALTGDPGFGCTLAECVNQLAEESESSAVALQFRHGGSACSIERTIRPSSRASLEVGDEVIRGAVKIEARLKDLLKVDKRILNEYVFVPQWEMFSFLVQKDADRAEAFSKLFGTERAEKIWRALGDVKVPDASVTVDRKLVETRLVNLDAEVMAYRELLKEDTALLEKLRAEAPGRQAALQARAARWAVEADLEQLRRARERAEESLPAAEASAREASALLTPVQALLADLTLKEEPAKSALQGWVDYKSAAGRRGELRIRLNNSTVLWQQCLDQVPEEVPGYIAVQDRLAARERANNALASLITLRRFITSCDPDAGISACPVCGTKIIEPGLSQRLAGAKSAVVVLDGQLQVLQKSLDSSDAYDVKKKNWQHRLDLVQADKARDADALDAVPTIPMPEMAEEEAAKVLFQLRRCRVDEPILLKRFYELRQLHLTLADRSAEASKACLALETRLAGMPVLSEEESNAIIDQDRLMVAKASAVAETSGKLRWAEKALSECQAEWKKYEQQLARFQQVEALKAKLGSLRALFHKAGLPAKVSQFCLHALRGDVDNLLERFDAPFRIADVVDLRLIVRFYDGRAGPASQMLSGGEKMILALAFRVAVGLLFAGDLGILCLDEPTVGLDASNLRCVEIALNRLREFGQARGLQFLLITHESGLDNLCDRVITLS